MTTDELAEDIAAAIHAAANSLDLAHVSVVGSTVYGWRHDPLETAFRNIPPAFVLTVTRPKDQPMTTTQTLPRRGRWPYALAMPNGTTWRTTCAITGHHEPDGTTWVRRFDPDAGLMEEVRATWNADRGEFVGQP
jgi:hypothetical protein